MALRLAAVLSLLSLVAMAPSCAPAPRAPIVITASLPIRELRLDNGLLVVLNPDASETSVHVHMRYHAGLKDDPPGRAGMAYLVAQISSENPARPGDLARRPALDRLGAVYATEGATYDFTDFRAEVPPALLGYVLWIEASRMAHAVDGVDDAALRRELAVVRNAQRADAGSRPYSLAAGLLTEAVFGSSHPYGRIVNMRRGELDRVTPAEIATFAARHYQPAHATLVVSGRFDAEEASKLVSRYFGPLRSTPLPPRDVLPAPRFAKGELVTYGAPVRDRVVGLGWLIPPKEKDGYDELAWACDSMQPALLGKLMSELGLVDEVSVTLHGGHLGTMLAVVARLRAAADPERVISEIERVMSGLGARGRTTEWDRFGEARLGRATWVIGGLESSARRTAWIQHDLEYTRAVRSPAAEMAKIQRYQPADVGGAVKQFVVDAPHAAVILEPDPNAPLGGARR